MEQNKIFNITKSTDDQIEKFSNIDAEVALIGCILWDNRNYEKISDFLDETHFVDQIHKDLIQLARLAGKDGQGGGQIHGQGHIIAQR